MNNILAKLKLDSHHSIERFGLTFLILVTCVAIVLTTIIFKYRKDNKQQLTSTVMYTTNFKTSKTGVAGTVENIYCDTKHTKAFLLLKFDQSAIKSISTDAKNYQMFLTGSSLTQEGTRLNINPSGLFYVFGTTGYMGIYLTEASGFENQILNLIVRCNNELVQQQTSDDEEVVYYDETFDEYDQFQIFFNPGGKSAPIAEFLDNSNDGITVANIYEELISRPQEMAIRQTLWSDLQKLKTDMDVIAEYERRVKDDGIAVKDPVSDIKGDIITDKKNVLVASLKYEDAKTKVDSNTMLYLKPKSVPPKGVNFNWQDKTIAQGYIKDLAGKLTPAQYLSQLLADTTTEVADTEILDTTWYRTDGTEFVVNEILDSDVQTEADIEALQEAWNAYETDKTTYMCTDLISLLKLEVQALDSDTNFTINNSDNVLTNWQCV